MQASISLIGSTGSIGTQTLDVARKLGLRVTALSAHSSVKLLEQQCREFKPKYVCIGEEKYGELKLALNDIDIEILCGDEGVNYIAGEDESQTIVNAVLDALRPLGVEDITMPCTPLKVWTAIQEARSGAGAHDEGSRS